MVDIPNYVRSKSQKLLSALDSVLSLPVSLDSQESGGSRGRRSLLRARSIRGPEEVAYEAGFTGETQSTAGHIDEAALASVLSCAGCSVVCGPPLTSCRKGHLYCPACRAALARTCRLCKQAVTSEAASHQENTALERLLSLIALPCQYK